MTMSSNPRRFRRDPAAGVDLLIAGASARSAVFSAIRGGFRVAAADLFADADLAENADATRIRNWPGGVVEWTRSFPGDVPFLYAGGLENCPEMLEEIARDRIVAGVMRGGLREIRDPTFLSAWCRRSGFRYPRLLSASTVGSRESLVKPRRGTAGLGIRCYEGGPLAVDDYLQEFVNGVSGSAAYLVNASGAEFLGRCRQLPREPSDAARLPPFLYRGSVTQRTSFDDWLAELGEGLNRLGVRGLCGVDFIDPGEGSPVILEINPRWTASMELLELRVGRSFISEHAACFGIFPSQGKPNDHSSAFSHAVAGSLGKRILFAPRAIRWRTPPPEILPPIDVQSLKFDCESLVPMGARHSASDRVRTGRASGTRQSSIDAEFVSDGVPVIADVPQPGRRIDAGEPLCTIFAAGDNFEACRLELLARERRLLAFLETAEPSG